MFRQTVRTKRDEVELRIRNRNMMFATLGLLALVFGLFVLLLYKPFFRFSTIRVVGAESLHTSDIGTEAQQVLREKYIWIIPKASWVTYPRKALRTHITNSFSRIEELSFSTDRFDTLVIKVKEWDPAYLWCGYLSSTEENVEIAPVPDLPECYYMDEQGIIFSEAPYFSNGVYVMMYTTDPSYHSVGMDDQVLSPELFKRALAIRDVLYTRGLSVSYMVFESHNDVRIGIDYIHGVRIPDALVWVNLDMSDQEIATMFALVLGHTTFNDRFAIQSDDLEYIDLRFSGKILFRFRNQQKVDAAPASS